MQAFKVSVTEILGRPGAYRDISLAAPLPGVATALARVPDDREVEARLRAESVVEGILVTGRATTVGSYECARCLKPLEDSLEIEVCELHVTPGHEVAPEEEAYEVRGTEVDLEPMLRDALTLALPLNPICRADCKGLCSHCGTDLNTGPCGCTENEIDPRWSALSGLREKLG